jgi:tetratricopeptide (TPR) repeat protein
MKRYPEKKARAIVQVLLIAGATTGPLSADPPTSVGTQHLATAPGSLTPVEYYRISEEANALFGGGKFADAEPLFAKLVASFAKDGENWWKLGRCQAAAGHYAEAIESYERAIELGTGELAAHNHQIAGLHSKLGNHEQAFAWLDRSLAVPHEDRRSLYLDLRIRELEPKDKLREAVGMLPEREFTRDEGWRYDLAFFAAEVERMHYSPWRRTTREDFHAAVKKLDERIPELSDAQVVVELQKLAASLGDGHSGINLESKRTPITPIPLVMYRFADGLFIIDADEAHRDLIGSRITAIGGVPSDEVFERLRTVVSHDNLMGVDWLGPRYLRVPAVLENLGLAKDSSQATFQIADRSGTAREVTLTPAPFEMSRRLFASKLPDAPEPPLYLKNVDQTFWIEPLPEQNAIYVQFNQVTDEPNESLAQFAVRLRNVVHEHPNADTLIMDVRHNSGGNTYLTIPLLKTLIHFETTRENPRLFAVIGRNTFSACQNFSTLMDLYTDAIFVGEPTGSSPNSIGESTTVVLPYSRANGGISTRYWQTGWPRDERCWIAPSIPAELSSADYFANRDPAVESILAIIAE